MTSSRGLKAIDGATFVVVVGLVSVSSAQLVPFQTHVSANAPAVALEPPNRRVRCATTSYAIAAPVRADGPDTSRSTQAPPVQTKVPPSAVPNPKPPKTKVSPRATS